MISTDQLPQQFRPLDAAEEAALRVSIKRFGVIYPVAVDTQGNILDGHHRYRLSKELDMKYPVLVIVQEGEPLPSDYLSRVNAAHPAAIHAGTRRVLSMDPEAIAQTLNMDRRHLTPDQRKELAVDLRREGRSERAIADALKVSQTTVHRDLEAATDSGESVQPVKVTGLDGKVRRAPVKKADTEGPRQMDAVYTRSKLPAGRTTTAKSPRPSCEACRGWSDSLVKWLTPSRFGRVERFQPGTEVQGYWPDSRPPCHHRVSSG